MPSKVVKWGAIAALSGVVLFGLLPDIGLSLRIVISGAAVVVLTQAATMRRYLWMTLFLIVACLFNPVFPVPLSKYLSSLVITFAALLFFFSLELLTPRPRRSVTSTTDRLRGSESL